MEISRIVGDSHLAELCDGLSFGSTQFVVSNFLGLATKLRGRKFLAANREVQRDSIYLYNYCGLLDLSSTDVTDKMAHVDDEKLSECVDGRANVLQTSRRGGQP